MLALLFIGGLVLLFVVGPETFGTIISISFVVSIFFLTIWLLIRLGIGELFTGFSESSTKVEQMSGREFEVYAENYLRGQGFKTQLTKASGDFGVDIIAKKNGLSYAVQVKRHSGRVSRRAISDAVAGRIHYRCDRAMVITNSTFTKSAVEMADSTDCELISNLR